MSHVHYSIVFRHDLRLMDVAWHRHFAAGDVGPYARECKVEFARQGFRPGYLLRMDMSQSAVQPQDAIAMFRTHFDGFPRARRIAVVTASAIARLQVKREMTQSYLQIFDRADTAFAWLTHDASILA
ncbi:MAG: STAS/SEC14 domain-containing protein [Pseudomonadota bacterium]|uniref:STAS/SEC14 domain-containing protein n=1 Tax=Sphingobium naphthae TaxID=1886786 RepID=UPI002B1A72B9|nr:STAS/SEC14 domain-containing protein [Pseudomonadota bacterium]